MMTLPFVEEKIKIQSLKINWEQIVDAIDKFRGMPEWLKLLHQQQRNVHLSHRFMEDGCAENVVRWGDLLLPQCSSKVVLN
uniref:Uncharacterized protein n=1 Tax=Glossina morsitans morsitans TaxID=37546 RepID=A0A1B0G913_GLOMM